MSRPRGGSLDPPVGGQYIVTHNKWSEHEVGIMKKIHSAYLRSLDVEEIQRLQDGASKSDTEFFLPSDSSLRSDRGELLKPLWGGRGPFESVDDFISSTHFAYWIAQTQSETGVDDMMNDWAKTIIKDICNEQSNNSLRDKSSGMFGGSSKLEHISPLSLVLHDTKLWCVMVLRTAKTSDRDTYMEVGRRIRFLIYLIPKDVWHVRSKLNPLSKGLTKDVHHSLVQCFQRVIAVLNEVQDYCFKRYLQQAIHEKVGLLLHLMQTEVFNVARFISAVCTFEEPVSVARERQLRQNDLVDASILQAYSDWTVLANVFLRYAFTPKFARASLSGDLKQFDAENEAVNTMKTWYTTNPFIFRQKKPDATAAPPPSDGKQPPGPPEPVLGDVQEDPKIPGMPLCYQAAVDSLLKELAEGSGMFGSAVAKHVRYPLSKEKQLANLKRAFPADGDRAKAVRAVARVIAALRDTIPVMFVLRQFSDLTRPDQRLIVDSVLRTEIIRCLADLSVRFAFVLTAAKCAVDDYSELAGKALAAMGKMDEAAQLLLNGPGVRREASTKVAVTNRKGSVVGTKAGAAGATVEDPTWVKNLDLACAELMPLVMEGGRVIFKNANELASELYHFTPDSTRQIETFEERACVTYCDFMTRLRGDDFSGTSFLVARIAPKKDYLNLTSKHLQETFRFVSEECAYQMEADSMAYTTKLAQLQQELQQSLKGSAQDDMEDDLDEAIGQMEIHASSAGNDRRAASSIASKSSAAKATSSTMGASTATARSQHGDDESDDGKKKSTTTTTKKRMSIFGKKLF